MLELVGKLFPNAMRFSGAGNALFSQCFSFMSVPHGGHDSSFVSLPFPEAAFEMWLGVGEYTDASGRCIVAGNLVVDASLFGNASAQRMVSAWTAALHAISSADDASTTSLAHVTDTMRSALRLSLGTPAAALVPEQPTEDAFAFLQAAELERANTLAVVDAASGALWTYEQLSRRVRSLATLLHARGVSSGD